MAHLYADPTLDKLVVFSEEESRLSRIARWSGGGPFIRLVTSLIPETGEPSSPQPGWVDYMIWCGVLATVGAANAFAIFFFSALITKK